MRKWWVKGLIIGVSILAILFVGRVGTSEYHYGCPYCGASCVESTVFYVPIHEKVREGELAKYYKSDVDPKHRHVWISRHANDGMTHRDFDNNFSSRWMLTDHCLVAILKALPTSKERKLFMQSLCRPECKAINELKDCYDNNPKRKDWQIIIKRLGLLKYQHGSIKSAIESR